MTIESEFVEHVLDSLGIAIPEGGWDDPEEPGDSAIKAIESLRRRSEPVLVRQFRELTAMVGTILGCRARGDEPSDHQWSKLEAERKRSAELLAAHWERNQA